MNSVRLAGLLLALSVPLQAAPQTTLDQETGSTLTIAAQPWIFARDQPSLAAHSRDFVGVHAVQINTAGKRSYFLAIFFWSTIDRREVFAGETPRVELLVDDRRVALKPSTDTLRDLGISKWPQPPPGKGARMQVYAVDDTLLRQLSVARLATIRLLDDQDGDDEPLDTWKEGRRALQDFVATTLD